MFKESLFLAENVRTCHQHGCTRTSILKGIDGPHNRKNNRKSSSNFKINDKPVTCVHGAQYFCVAVHTAVLLAEFYGTATGFKQKTENRQIRIASI
jgi:hypothetical protein